MGNSPSCYHILAVLLMAAFILPLLPTPCEAANTVITVEPEKSTAFEFFVENPSNEPVIYSIYIKGWHPWLMIVDSQVLLEPSETRPVTIIAFPTSQISAGIYPLEIIAESNADRQTDTVSLDILPLGTPPVIKFATLDEDSLEISARLTEPLELKVWLYRDGQILREFTRSFSAGDNVFEESLSLGPGNYSAEIRLQKSGEIVYSDTLTYVKEYVSTVEVSEVEWDYLVWSGRKIAFYNKGTVSEVRDYSVEVSQSQEPFFKSSDSPTITTQNGTRIYSWELLIGPGEEKVLSYTYNYTIFLLLVLLSVFFATALYSISRKDVMVKKAIVGRGLGSIKGDQEIKICLEVINRTRKEVNNLTVEDFVQPLFKLSKDFSVKPRTLSRVGDDIKMTWHIARLEPKETRVFCYKIVPKIGLGGEYSFAVARLKYSAGELKKSVFSNQIVIGRGK